MKFRDPKEDLEHEIQHLSQCCGNLQHAALSLSLFGGGSPAPVSQAGFQLEVAAKLVVVSRGVPPGSNFDNNMLLLDQSHSLLF